MLAYADARLLSLDSEEGPHIPIINRFALVAIAQI
jgi:hypothetical protein